MKGLTKFLLLCATISGLVLINLYMATNPVDVTAIQSPKYSLAALSGEVSLNGQAGTNHIEELTFVQTFQRPLFSTTRRKYQPPKAKPKPKKQVAKKAPPKKNPIKPPKFKLMGVSMIGASSRALIADGSGEEPQWVVEGDSVLEWTLEKIHDQSVIVTREELEVTIDLYPQKPQSQ